MDSVSIDQAFTYHPPRGDIEILAYQTIRDTAKRFAFMIDAMVPDSREKSIAITKIREAVMWANAGIAINGGNE